MSFRHVPESHALYLSPPDGSDLHYTKRSPSYTNSWRWCGARVEVKALCALAPAPPPIFLPPPPLVSGQIPTLHLICGASPEGQGEEPAGLITEVSLGCSSTTGGAVWGISPSLVLQD